MTPHVVVAEILDESQRIERHREAADVFGFGADVGHDAPAVVDLAPGAGPVLGDERVGYGLYRTLLRVGVVDGLNAAARRNVVFGRGELQHGVVAQRPRRLHKPLAVAALADDHRTVEVLQGAGHDLRRRCRIAVDEHRQRQVGEDRLRRGAVNLPRILRTAFGAYHLGAFGNEHAQNLDRLLHDAAAVAAVIEDQTLQFSPGAQLLDGCAHVFVTPFGKVAVTDVTDAVGHPAGVRHARNGDALALQGDGLGAAVEVLDGHLDLAARLPLEPGADLLGRKAFGVLAVDGEDLVADLQPGPVGGRTLVGLGDLHPVALLADERSHAAVFARGEQLEVGHLLLRDEFGVRIEVADHAFGGPFHEFVGVHRVYIAQRQFAHHVDHDLHVAPQSEVVAGGEGQQGCCRSGSGGREQITVSFSNHVLSFVCMNPACIRLWPRRGVCRRSGSTVRTVKLLSRLLPAASA